jgi:hypothetical protein
MDCTAILMPICPVNVTDLAIGHPFPVFLITCPTMGERNKQISERDANVEDTPLGENGERRADDARPPLAFHERIHGVMAARYT